VASPTDDVDQLTKGMKKIKINVVTAAQKEARAKAKAEKESITVKQENQPTALTPTSEAPGSRLPPTPAMPLPLSPVSPDLDPPKQPVAAPSIQQRINQLNSGPSTPAQERPVFLPADTPLPASSSPVYPSTPTMSLASPQPAAAPAVFVPYQPEGATPEALPQSRPLMWLPPNNAGTPSPMKRGDLPVFSATGVIPFAAIGSGSADGGKGKEIGKTEDEEKDGRGSIWDIPETPQK
jgi:histone deacetylase HOS3